MVIVEYAAITGIWISKTTKPCTKVIIQGWLTYIEEDIRED